MFRPDANLGLRIVRTVFVPSGPLIAVVALGSAQVVSEHVLKLFALVGFAWFFCSLIIVPALLFRADSSPGSGGDDGGGGGDGPPQPPSRGPGPGGIPLPDAEQSGERVRDHVRRKPRWRRRRGAHEPEPTRSPTVRG